MAERLFAAIRNIPSGEVYVTSFDDQAELEAKLNSEVGKVELVKSSQDYESILKVFEDETTPSILEGLVKLSTNKRGSLNAETLLSFLKKTK